MQVPFELTLYWQRIVKRERNEGRRKEGRSVGPGCSVKEKPLIRRCWGEMERLGRDRFRFLFK
jgi:hypothetical protein